MTASAEKAAIPVFLIVLAPVREGDLDSNLASRLAEYAQNSVMVLAECEETAAQAAQQGLRTMTVPFQMLEGSFVSQVRACTGLLVYNGVLSLHRQVVFVSQKAVSIGLYAFEMNCGALAVKVEPCLFIRRTSACEHPLRLKTGFVIIDLDLQVQVLTGRSTHFGPFVPAGQLQTSDFPLSWVTYGIRRSSGYAGMVRASHEGISFVMDDHVKRFPPAFASPILLHYEIRDPNTARRQVAAEEVSSQAGTLHFVPAYQETVGSSVLFVLLEDGSTAVFVNAKLSDFNLVLPLYPDRKALPSSCEDCKSLRIPGTVMRSLERMSHIGREYVGPLRLSVPPSWKRFLAVLLAHNSSGDVDILHHIPMRTSPWAYDHAADAVLVNGERKIYGRQALPDIYSPEIATGTANALLGVSEDNAQMIVLASDFDRPRNSVHCFPCDNEAMAPGFLSALRNKTAEIFKMEAGFIPVNLELLGNSKKCVQRTREKLCRHKIIMATKSMLLDQLVLGVAEMPLAKVLDVHSRYVSQAWHLTSELLGRRLPALHHAARPEAEQQLLPRGFSHYRRFGSGIFKRPMDVMPTADGSSIWVTDCDAACVWRLDRQGSVMEKLEYGLKSPRYFIADDGMFYLSDPFAKKMVALLPSGKMVPFPCPMLLKFQGDQFWPIAGYRVGDQYVYRAMDSELNVGVFLCDLNGANAEILVNAQPALYCLDTFDAGEQRMVLASSNERTLYVYTFATREWQTLILPLEIPNITGLSLIGDCVLIRSPPQVICYDLVKCGMRFNAYIPDLIGHCKWPFNAFRACTKDGQTTLYLATMNNDIAAIELCKAAN